MEDGGPSATARRVAAHRLGFTRVAAGYGDPAADVVGSQLAISVSGSRAAGDGSRARARFRAAVAAMGEPVRSAFEAGQAEALLARTGWQVAGSAPDGAGRGTTAARRERLRSAGLLTATAGSR